MRGQLEVTLYSRARFNSTNHAAKPRHIVKLDRKILMQEVLAALLNYLCWYYSLAKHGNDYYTRGRISNIIKL